MSHRLTVTAAAATVATSAVLYPLVAGGRWFWLELTAVIVVALTGTATRLRPLPLVACLLAELAALLVYLNIVFSGARSFAGIAPTRSSLRYLWLTAQQGMDGVHRYAPPVPDTAGILLLTTAGVGVIAIAADLLAVRLRRPALAGLPLLVLFCVPLSTTVSPGPVGATIGFGLSAAGYLALLSADGREKVRLWGRLVSIWQPGRGGGLPETRKLAAAGRRIGFTAAVLALFVPLLLPGRPAHRLLSGGPGLNSGSGGGLFLPNPLAVLNQQLHESSAQTVLTYRTSDPTPPYLQVYVLGKLGDNAWSMSGDIYHSSVPVIRGKLPAPPGLNPGTPGPVVRETISLAKRLHASSPGLSYLPIPYPARAVAAPGDWRVDRRSLSVFAAGTGPGLSGLTYTVTAKDVNPAPLQLRQALPPPASMAAYRSVPQAFSSLAPLARRITAHRGTAYSRAVALQRWFTHTGHFTYSLNVPKPDGANALIDFLTKSKRGYCQQFAFAMAVLARLLGIPSRVVVGYTQGSFVGGTLWRVTTQDAHAWPELYFQGAGWLRFEPTPDGTAGPGQPTASPPVYSYQVPSSTASSAAQGAAPRHSGATGARSGSPRTAGNPRAPVSSGRAGASTGGNAPGRSLPIGWLAAGLLAVALVTPRSVRSLTRRRRWLTGAHDGARAETAWREVSDDLADHGISSRLSESPRAVAQRATVSLQLRDAEQAALGRVVTAVERARYAPTPAATPTLRADVALLRRAVARCSGRAARWRARLIPSSALAPARAGLQQLLDVFGWLDRLASWVGSRGGWKPGGRRRAG